MANPLSYLSFAPIRSLGLAVNLAFIAVMSGGQFATVLLPVYSAHLELDPFALSAVQMVFLIALAGSLLVSARPALHHRATPTLITALLVMLAADIFTSTATLQGLLVGRALGGLSLGFASGAAATIAVAALGARGRTAVATSTVVGGLSGAVVTVLLAELFFDPLQLNFVVHAVVVLATLMLLLAALIGARKRPKYTAEHARTERKYGYRHSTGYVLGILSWICGSLVVVIVPNGAMRTIPGVGLLVATLGTIFMLSAAVAAQYLLSGLRPRIALHFCFLTLAGGMMAIAVGLAAQSIPIVLFGCAIVGAGEGLGYRTGLKIISGGLPPRDQGARTSIYACLAYGTSAVVVLLSGWIVVWLGFGGGTIALASAVIPVVIIQLVLVERDARRGAESTDVPRDSDANAITP